MRPLIAESSENFCWFVPAVCRVEGEEEARNAPAGPQCCRNHVGLSSVSSHTVVSWWSSPWFSGCAGWLWAEFYGKAGVGGAAYRGCRLWALQQGGLHRWRARWLIKSTKDKVQVIDQLLLPHRLGIGLLVARGSFEAPPDNVVMLQLILHLSTVAVCYLPRFSAFSSSLSFLHLSKFI